MTRGWLGVAACVLAGLMAGCKGSTDMSPRPVVKMNGQEYRSSGQAVSMPIDEALRSDPCAARLHAISGAMLEYYALHNRLPPALQNLASLADLDEPLNFTCPETGRPYVYVPTGLQSPKDSRLIVVHDAETHRSGQRWVILLQKPKGRQAASLWVVPMGEGEFRAHTPAPPPASRPAIPELGR
jgi:hypothetical protein